MIDSVSEVDVVFVIVSDVVIDSDRVTTLDVFVDTVPSLMDNDSDSEVVDDLDN